MTLPILRPIGDRVELKTSTTPEVTVLIPVHGQWDYTLRCLASIAQSDPELQYEVLVVDDASPDDTLERLNNCAGVRICQTGTNVGFIRACNLGASQARGAFICFLNNDTEVSRGWLEELRDVFERFPDVGLAGSRLMYPDGSLQEAGCLLWRDGSGWNRGRGLDPADPRFSYARPVDYCSAASVMVRRQDFLAVGGFNDAFAPAYCEDADLALQLRERGMSCLVQPLSMVIHHEGVSCGDEETKGHKRFQVKNQHRLAELRKSALSLQPMPGADPEIVADRMLGPRCLVIDEGTPLTDRDAGSVACFNLMVLLRHAGLAVSFIPDADRLYLPTYTAALQREGIEALYAPFVASTAAHLANCGDRYELVILIRPDVAECNLDLVRLRCPGARVLYLAPDLHFLRLQRECQALGRDDGSAVAMRERELALMAKTDGVIVHSTVERELLSTLVHPIPVSVFPWVVSARGAGPGFDARRDILFLGGFQHAPNVDAVRHFVMQILPKVCQRLPGVRLRVVGSNPPPELLDLASASVQFFGHVPDLGPILDAARVAVAPLRFGAGVKGKLVTTMGAGLPCVATSIAVEGMSLTGNSEVLVADDDQGFADAVVALHEDAALWSRISRDGLNFASRTFGEEAGASAVLDILDSVGIAGLRRKCPPKLMSPSGPVINRRSVRPERFSTPMHIVRIGDSDAQATATRAMMESVARERAEGIDSAVLTVNGYCEACGQRVPLLVNAHGESRTADQRWLPNWRESLVCPLCGMNSRQRLMAGLIAEELSGSDALPIYLMEQVTPLFQWAHRRFGPGGIHGSEYLGEGHCSGVTVNGICHEDALALSFADDSFGMVVSSDVFEHVADPDLAFQECARVLRPGGTLLFTVPFDAGSALSAMRAIRSNGIVSYIKPPVFHGNPLSAAGSLVFADFGWDILDRLSFAGFETVQAEFYAPSAKGTESALQIIFRACTPRSPTRKPDDPD